MKETNQFQIFNSPEFGKVRIIVGNDGEPKFSLSDICKILGLVSTKTAQRLGDDVLSKHPIVDRLGRQQIANLFLDKTACMILYWIVASQEQRNSASG